MNGDYELRRVSDLRPDPANSTIFNALDADDLRELADSISEHGLINPVTILPDGRIIAGEQRWRAAQVAGIGQIAVIVRAVNETEAEVLRIEENLRRRTLKASETARAIRRLYELHGIAENKGGRPKQETPTPGVGVSEQKTAEDVARDAGVSPTKARILNRLADLIPPLMARLDAGSINQKMAYGFAQLAPHEQEDIEAELGANERHLETTQRELDALQDQVRRFTEEMEDAVATVRADMDIELSISKDEIERLRAEQAAEIERLKEEEEKARQDLIKANEKLKQDLLTYRRTEHFKKNNKTHLTLQALDKMMTLRPDDCANEPKDLEAIRLFLEADQQTALAAVEWLREYAHALGKRLGDNPPPQLLMVK